jgi:hypothetical protein
MRTRGRTIRRASLCRSSSTTTTTTSNSSSTTMRRSTRTDRRMLMACRTTRRGAHPTTEVGASLRSWRNRDTGLLTVMRKHGDFVFCVDYRHKGGPPPHEHQEPVRRWMCGIDGVYMAETNRNDGLRQMNVPDGAGNMPPSPFKPGTGMPLQPVRLVF